MVQTTEHIVSSSAERHLLLYMIIVLIVVTGLIILFFVVFQRRKNKLLLDKIQQEQEFQETLIKTQSEIQEQTLKNVGQELHDNIGQLLSVVSMQLNLVSSLAQESVKKKVEETKNVVNDAIKEVRSLSKGLNSEVIFDFGLKKSIQNEVDRLNKLKSFKANLVVEGSEIEIPNKDVIIIFRIFQEFLSNTIKYAEAKTFDVTLKYFDNSLVMIVKDDGIGFDLEKVKKGSGLINMQDRSALINTHFHLTSQPRNGTELELIYPIEKIS